ncbi:beta-TrCP [Eurytemora carolleeae]|uniref:beta-TrCP n=1 Tax=Eurytemora carolleeae TaxID=1294199 RepID=UPI000C75A32B|nr:beta-TrCP [Eurytemora carolleeae]|eukprot:XP_023331292.1 beta-TrCP-like [Eurytemora affinis]
MLSNDGLLVLFKLINTGHYPTIIDRILMNLDGITLSSLELGSTQLQAIIQDMFWRNKRRLELHWDSWLPTRTRLECGVQISSLAQFNLEIFCGLKSGKVQIYDSNLILETTLEFHSREVLGISSNGDVLVSVGRDSQLCVWSFKRKNQRHLSITLPHQPLCVKLQGELVFVGLESGGILVFQHLTSTHLVHKQELVGHTQAVTCLDADTLFLISGSQDNTLKLWSRADGRKIKDLTGHVSKITTVRMIYPTAISGSRGAERCIRIWNVQAGWCMFKSAEN